jgi:hypothetical protein
MMELVLPAIVYVTSDPYFWSSMAFTTMVGIFIGAIVNNGDLEQVKKTILSIFSYFTLIAMVNLTRVIPQIIPNMKSPHQIFASTVTLGLVTLFYLLGIFLGVYMVRTAKSKGKDK